MNTALAALIVALLVGPPASALALLEERATADGKEVRVSLDEGDLVGCVIEGTAGANGLRLSEALADVPGKPGEWRGFPRTLLVRLVGNGTVVLADDASGVVVRLAAPPPPDPRPAAAERPPTGGLPTDEGARPDLDPARPASLPGAAEGEVSKLPAPPSTEPHRRVHGVLLGGSGLALLGAGLWWSRRPRR